MRISLDDTLVVVANDQVVAAHRLQAASAGWVTLAEHHAPLWQTALEVEQRPLAVYEEVRQWS